MSDEQAGKDEAREQFIEATSQLTDELLDIISAKLRSLVARPDVTEQQVAGALAASAASMIKLVAVSTVGTGLENQERAFNLLEKVLDQLKFDLAMVLLVPHVSTSESVQ